jgi:hypothetical protein
MPGPKGEERSSVVWWILSFVTCGIGLAYWIWKTETELKEFMQTDDINPIIAPILCFVTGIGPLFHAWKMGGWIMQARQMVGLPAEDKSTKYVIFTFILGLSTKMIQDDLNELWQQAGGAAAPPAA